ncbi:MAG: hypothetical protein HQ525_04530 [Anaerolineae bacterium]|uniref:NERD domain-containing protein n=1 Tax=Candidatus Desulfolinea nitratireducens TaxID=2841698 RepID=A0A8J6NJX4_9CHLR|nr:hypothetical protein [Candidatus Desulfolinea nitratireducens]NQU29912.1 hypothetical protein [Anaerolineae bacterium]
MRIIDNTPFINEDGSVSFIDRIQGTLQYGFSWYPNLQVQQKAIAILKKHLDKRFTLIRNHTLENSEITIPLILIGPPGIQVIFVTHLQGSYRARNDSWGVISDGKFKESGINLLKRTAQFGKAVDVYLKRKGLELTEGIEPILLSVNPTMHIASERPIVRIVMSDAAERFAASLTQNPPVMSAEDVHEVAEAIVNPHRPKASPTTNDMGKIGFAFDDEIPAKTPTPRVAARRPAKKASTDYFGMTGKQFAVLGILGAIVVCLLIAFIIGILFFA